MPTGYTEAIANGTETTLREFALRCTQAFIPEALRHTDESGRPIIGEYSEYHTTQLAEWTARLDSLRRMTSLERQAELNRVTEEEDARHQEMMTNFETVGKRYQHIQEEMRLHFGELCDIHWELTKFMDGQLRESMKHDCLTRGDIAPLRKMETDAEIWWQDAISEAIRNIEYHREQVQNQAMRRAQCIQLINKLNEFFEKQ